MPSVSLKLALLGSAAAFDVSAPVPALNSPGKHALLLGCDLQARTARTGRNAGNARSHQAELVEPGQGCIYDAVTRGGRTTPIFKAMLSTHCGHACKYCFTRCLRRRATFTPEEYAATFIKLFLQQKVTGVFISSGIMRDDPDYTTRQMIEAVRLIREKYNFGGYVHFKALPGVERALLVEAARYADRMSINLESPTRDRLATIAPEKDFKQDLVLRQQWIRDLEKRGRLPAGHTTQFVVGAADETDAEILERVDWEYSYMRLHRAYFSRFTPLRDTPLQDHPETPASRERRLYQADFLLRRYDIPLAELRQVLTDDGALPPGDPKVHLARHFFAPGETVDVMEAPYEHLIRVPGIGPRTARKILRHRAGRHALTKPLHLHRLGVGLDKALPFISIAGRRQKSLDAFLAAA